MNIEVSNSKIKYSKKILLLSLVILICLFTIIGIIVFSLNQKIDVKTINSVISLATPSPAPTIQIESLEDYSNYFVPVTGFKELRNNVTFDELKAIDIKVNASQKDLISKAFPDFKLTTIEDLSFIDNIANGKDIGIVLWSDLNPRLKALSVDNKFLFDKTINLSDYSLKQILKATKTEISKLSVFDIKKINRILGTGEIIPARTVERFMKLKNDYTYPFLSVKPFMDKYDAQISTFESSLLGTGNGPSCALGCMTFIGNEKFLSGMKYSGIDLVSLANNHSMNGGIEGIANAIKLLNAEGIKTVGASSVNNEEATKPGIIELNGIKYGIIAYNDIPSVNDWATDTHGGTARIDTNDYQILPDRVTTDVKRAKDMGAQFIIAMMHWGSREYTNEPLPHQKDLAHNLIDNGVDLILGDHPHWVMAVEFYKDKFIYYGIGNFVFDQDWSVETSQGSFLEMNFYNDKLLSLKIYPHQIIQTQPRLVDENTKEYKQIFDRIWQYTGKL